MRRSVVDVDRDAERHRDVERVTVARRSTCHRDQRDDATANSATSPTDRGQDGFPHGGENRAKSAAGVDQRELAHSCRRSRRCLHTASAANWRSLPPRRRAPWWRALVRRLVWVWTVRCDASRKSNPTQLIRENRLAAKPRWGIPKRDASTCAARLLMVERSTSLPRFGCGVPGECTLIPVREEGGFRVNRDRGRPLSRHQGAIFELHDTRALP
jgi:hypothetical protein